MKEIHDTYRNLVLELISFIEIIESHVINGEEFFLQYEKFYKKSFLISGCTYLESYLKDVWYFVVDDWKRKIDSIWIPKQLIEIKYDKKLKWLSEEFCLNFTHEEVDELISGNISKTIKFFHILGIDLQCNQLFLENKDLVWKFVELRNKVIHHNSDLNFVSLWDIKIWLSDWFLNYWNAIQQEVWKKVK